VVLLNFYVFDMSHILSRVDDFVGEGCLSKSDLLFASVEDRVESLKGNHAKDEVKSLS
jgi:hypothetical protein